MSDDPWRLRCPEDHVAVEQRAANFYWCETCQKRYAGDPGDGSQDAEAPMWPDFDWPVVVGQPAYTECYHTEVCRYVVLGLGSGAEIHQDADRLVAFHDLRECSHCQAGGIGSSVDREMDRSTIEAVKQMDADAVAPTRFDSEVAADD